MNICILHNSCTNLLLCCHFSSIRPRFSSLPYNLLHDTVMILLFPIFWYFRLPYLFYRSVIPHSKQMSTSTEFSSFNKIKSRIKRRLYLFFIVNKIKLKVLQTNSIDQYFNKILVDIYIMLFKSFNVVKNYPLNFYDFLNKKRKYETSYLIKIYIPFSMLVRVERGTSALLIQLNTLIIIFLATGYWL